MKIKKRSVTLTELLIGCVLLAALLTLLFGLLREVKGGEKLVRKERGYLAEEFRLEARLDQLLLKAVPLKESHPGFYTDESLGLVFVSRVGAAIDGPFVDRILCRLYRSDQGDLTLDYWPDPIRMGVEPKEMRREILFSNVDAIEWSFYSPPKKDVIVENARIGSDKEDQDPPSGQWNPLWKVGYKKIPPLMRLTVRRGEKTLIYETYLPATSFPLELPE